MPAGSEMSNADFTDGCSFLLPLFGPLVPMQFALLGDMPESVWLTDGLLQCDTHSLTHCCVSPELAAQLSTSGHSYVLSDTEADTFLAEDAGIVIVAWSDVERSIESCRRVSQEGKPLLVFLPEGVSTAFSYELHLLLDEAIAGVVAVSGRWFCDVPDQVPATQLRISLRQPTEDARFRRLQIHAIDLMTAAGGEYTQVTGLDIPAAAGTSRMITLARQDGAAAPATIQFDGGADVAALTVVSDDGEQQYPSDLPLPDQAPASAQRVESVLLALDDPAQCQLLMRRLSASLELMEGLDKSLRRRRTVDVHADSLSERSVFKTQMTAIGCGVLAWMSLGIMIIAAVRPIRKQLPSFVIAGGMILWVLPLVLFILTQFLLPLARERVAVSSDPTVDESTAEVDSEEGVS